MFLMIVLSRGASHIFEVLKCFSLKFCGVFYFNIKDLSYFFFCQGLLIIFIEYGPDLLKLGLAKS